MIIQEINLLHVRGNRMAVFSGMQTIGFSIMMIATGHITDNLGWRWWYYITAIISLVVAILCIAIVPESRYQRQEAIVPSEHINARMPIFYTDKRKPTLDTATYGEAEAQHGVLRAAIDSVRPASLSRHSTLASNQTDFNRSPSTHRAIAAHSRVARACSCCSKAKACCDGQLPACGRWTRLHKAAMCTLSRS